VRGREVFFGAHATCSTCHTIRSEGGHVGPDLSRIATVRSGRDLLEAILYPSASFARGFEPFNIATNDGRTYTGIITRETSDAIKMVTPDRMEVSIPRSTIEEIEQSRVSIMPRGLDANLSRQELGDLLAFLRSLK
jgi:putative heme-binding domain-containing protein